MGDLVWNLFMGREGGYSQNVGVLIVLVDSNNGLSPVRRQAIIWTNTSLLTTGPVRTYFSEIWKKKLIEENESENVICQIEAILSQP